MDIDNSSDSDAGSDSSADAVQAALLASKTFDALGGSVSRSARLRATTTDEEGQEDDDEDPEDEEDEDDDVHVGNGFAKMRSSPSKAGRSNSAARPSAFVTASRGERYLVQASKPAKTSASKLSDAFVKPCAQKDLVQLLVRQSTSPKGKATERQLRAIEDAYMQLFPQWAAELEQHFKLVFHGLGSKIRLLNLFVQTRLRAAVADRRVLLLDGYRADTSLLDLVQALEGLLYADQSPVDDNYPPARTAARVDERIAAILEKLDSLSRTGLTRPKPIYLLIHSIDGPALRSPRSQAAIWTLSNHPHVRLLASLDHIKAPLLFPTSTPSTSKASAGSRPMIYHHTPTLRPYTVEALASGCMSALYPQSLFLSDLQLLQGKEGGMRGASSAARAKAAAFVLASLTQKAKDIFYRIAARQIASVEPDVPLSRGETPPFAMRYSSLFTEARDAFLANNVGQLEALLRELRDHEIVLSSAIRPAGTEPDPGEHHDSEIGQRGIEWLWINIDAHDLQSLLDRLQT